MKLKRHLLLGRKAMTDLNNIKKERQHFANKAPCNQSYGFTSSHYRWTIKETEHQRIDAFKLWCWRRLLSPLDSKEIKLLSPKRNQPWIFIGRTDAEAEAPILWSPHAKSRLIGKEPDAGKDWGQEEKGATEDEMVRYHHQLNGHKFEQTLGDSGGWRSLACYCPWGLKEWDTT